MRLALVTPPANKPLNVEEVKEHLRITVDDEDGYIETLIHAATEHLDGRDGRLGRALLTQTWEMTLAQFPSGEPSIILPLPPLQSVVSVTYVGSSATWAGSPEALAYSTMPASDYIVDASSRLGRVILRDDKSWPGTYNTLNAVRVRFIAGYGAAGANLPAPIRQALLLLIAHWYEHREEVVVGQPVAPMLIAADALLGPYEVITFA